MRLSPLRSTAGLLWLLGLSACLASNPPIPLRYFEPALGDLEASQRPDLVVERVVAAPHLDQRMVWRLSDVEIAYDEQHRWITTPADLVEAAVRGAIHGASTGSNRLRIEVVAFEGVAGTGDSQPEEAHVELLCTHTSGRDQPITQARFDARAPLDGNRPEDLARALGKALTDAVRRAADWTPQAER